MKSKTELTANQRLKAFKDEYGFSIPDLMLILKVPRKTLERWLADPANTNYANMSSPAERLLDIVVWLKKNKIQNPFF